MSFWTKLSSSSFHTLGQCRVRLWERPSFCHSLVSLSYQDRWKIKNWDFEFRKLLWTYLVLLQKYIQYVVKVTKVAVTNGMEWTTLHFIVGACLVRRDAIQFLKQISLAVAESWSQLETSKVNQTRWHAFLYLNEHESFGKIPAFSFMMILHLSTLSGNTMWDIPSLILTACQAPLPVDEQVFHVHSEWHFTLKTIVALFLVRSP